MSEPPFLGPAWARATTCCGKPVGCTNMSDQCRMRNHPWKRWLARTARHTEECPSCVPGRPCAEYLEMLRGG